MKPTPKLNPHEFYVRQILHGGEGPLSDDGEHVIGKWMTTAADAAQIAAEALDDRQLGICELAERDEGEHHLSVETHDGQRLAFVVRCRLKAEYTAEPAGGVG